MAHSLSDYQKDEIRKLFDLKGHKIAKCISKLEEDLEWVLAESYLPSSGSSRKPIDEELSRLKDVVKKANDLTKHVSRLNESMNYRIGDLVSFEIVRTSSDNNTVIRWSPLDALQLIEIFSKKTESVLDDFTGAYGQRNYDCAISALADYWRDTLNKEIGSLSDNSQFVQFVAIIIGIDNRNARQRIQNLKLSIK